MEAPTLITTRKALSEAIGFAELEGHDAIAACLPRTADVTAAIDVEIEDRVIANGEVSRAEWCASPPPAGEVAPSSRQASPTSASALTIRGGQ